jgi:hypothetical protein
MCRRVTCRTCGRPDWRGCGAHVEQVLGDIPRAERCQCREKAANDRSQAGPERGSWLKRLLGA